LREGERERGGRERDMDGILTIKIKRCTLHMKFVLKYSLPTI
jgi:hypothetical protein